MLSMTLPRTVADALARWKATRRVTKRRKLYLASAGLKNIYWPEGRRNPSPLESPRQVLEIIEPFGLDRATWPKRYLLIDARAIQESKAWTCSRGTHIGTHAIILKHVLKSCRRFLVDTLKNLHEFMQETPANTKEPLLVLCVCDWGKHPSVALVWFMDCLLTHLGHKTHIWHMNKGRWSFYKSCGRNACTDCDQNCEEKMQLAAELYLLWDRFFAPPPPVA